MRRNSQQFYYKNPLEKIPESKNEEEQEINHVHFPQKTEKKKAQMPTCFGERIPYISKKIKNIAKSKREVIPQLLMAMKEESEGLRHQPRRVQDQYVEAKQMFKDVFGSLPPH